MAHPQPKRRVQLSNDAKHLHAFHFEGHESYRPRVVEIGLQQSACRKLQAELGMQISACSELHAVHCKQLTARSFRLAVFGMQCPACSLLQADCCGPRQPHRHADVSNRRPNYIDLRRDLALVVTFRARRVSEAATLKSIHW